MFKKHKQYGFLRRAISALIVISFICSSVITPNAVAQIYPQTVLGLPMPGTMLHQSPAFDPVLIRGITLDSQNPLHFNFVVSQGDTGFDNEQIRKESEKLIKYFLASLTVPEDELWVNLSPYEKDRIIPDTFGSTEMGRDLLAQDYMLKQLTSSMMYPEDELGAKFWDRVYEKANKEYGVSDIPRDVFNKVWIVPEKAVVYEYQNSAFIVDSHLKVMLETDYAAMKKHKDAGSEMLDASKKSGIPASPAGGQDQESSIQTDIIKEIIIPELEKEINTGKNFASLRQIYSAVILATWFDKNLKQSLLGKEYVGKGKVEGIKLKDISVNQKIYEQYLEAFKKGAYNYIKEDYDPKTQQIIPRKYFSGGAEISRSNTPLQRSRQNLDAIKEALSGEELIDLDADFAMTSSQGNEKMGNQWVQLPRSEVNRLRSDFIRNNKNKIEKSSDAIQQELVEQLMDNNYRVLRYDQREEYIKDFNEQLKSLKKSDTKSYYKALLISKFIAETFGLYYIDRPDFILRNNPLESNSAFEYFLTSKPIDYDQKRKIVSEVEKGFHFTASLYTPSVFHIVYVEPDAYKMFELYRILSTGDEKLLKIYLDDFASRNETVKRDDLVSILEMACYAISHKMSLTEEFILGIVPILRAAKFSISDTDFIEVYVSHLLNSKNFDEYFFLIRRLLDTIPIQIRTDGKNELRETLSNIDDSRGRKKDIFRYLRVIFHKYPGVRFRDMIVGLVYSIYEGRTEAFLRNYMDEEGQRLFLTANQLAVFKIWEKQIRGIIDSGKASSPDELLALSRAEFQSIVKSISSEYRDNISDWTYLFEIVKSSIETYSAKKVNVKGADLSENMLKTKLMQRRKLLSEVSIIRDKLGIMADYQDRRHKGEFLLGYEGYEGVDAEYSERGYNLFVQSQELRSQAEEALTIAITNISTKQKDLLTKGLSSQDEWEEQYEKTKEILQFSLEALILDGFGSLGKDLKGLKAASSMLLSPSEMNDLLDQIERELDRIFDYLNEELRRGAKMVSINYDGSERYRKVLSGFSNAGKDQKTFIEEKVVGDLFSDDVSFFLTKRAIDLMREVVKYYKDAEAYDKGEKVRNVKLFQPFSSSNNLYRHLYGAKAEKLQRSSQIGLNVPKGLVIKMNSSEGQIKRNIKDIIGTLEQETGRKFPDLSLHPDLSKSDDLLLVSVRSGSFVSMPGMLETILNVPMNDEIVKILIEQNPDEEWFIYDTYRRFLNYYAVTVLGVPDNLFVDAIDAMKQANVPERISSISEFSISEMQELIRQYKEIIRDFGGGNMFSLSSADLLFNAIIAVKNSWDSDMAKEYRQANNISDNWGTGVIVQEMVFGNKNKNSGTAVLYTHDPATQVAGLTGEYKIQGQGEDVVSGRTSTTLSIEQLEENGYGTLFNAFDDIAKRLYKEFKTPQEIEVTVQDGAVYILQTRNMEISKNKTFIKATDEEPLAVGQGQSSGATIGRFLFMGDSVEETRKRIKKLRKDMDARGESGVGIILVSYYLTPQESVLFLDDDITGAICAVKGGSAHATIVARRHGKPLVSGVNNFRESADKYYIGDVQLVEGLEGDIYTIDGNSQRLSQNGGKIFQGALDIEDSAMTAANPLNGGTVRDEAVETSKDLGGIDMNPSLMDLDINKDQINTSADFNVEAVDGININGLIPIIINVTPINSLPQYLGAIEIPENSPELAQIR